MRRLLLRLIGLTAATVAAVLVWAVATLPPASVPGPAQPAPPNRVVGAYHIHTARSDGSGTVDDVAAAAARAGLRFIILTDHGDATRTPDPPTYRHGVLCIDAVEVSSGGGHVVALNLSAASPYPLGGETRDVLEDIHRMGGWAIAAHPDSPKEELRWRDGGPRDLGAIDGIEWFNADSEWRAHSPGALAAAATHALFRAPESVAALFQAPVQTLARWDVAQNRSAPFGIAALDAHAPIALAFPSYETMFRTITQTVALERAPTGDAAADAADILAAIRAGRSYSVVRAFIDAPYALDFSATGGEAVAAGATPVVHRAEFGGAIESTGVVAFHAAIPSSISARLVLIGNGREVASGIGSIDYTIETPGAYRVEARLSGRSMPWIVSNAIHVNSTRTGLAPGLPSRDPVEDPGTPIAVSSWVVEKDPSSTGTIDLNGSEVHLRYRVGPNAQGSPFVAISSGASGSTPIAEVAFTASSSQPMRISVQVRVAGGQRFARSVYIDQTPRVIRVALAALEPVDRRTQLRPIAARVQSILIVIDTVNTRPGSDGEVVLRDLAYVPGRDTADAPPTGAPVPPGRRGR